MIHDNDHDDDVRSTEIKKQYNNNTVFIASITTSGMLLLFVLLEQQLGKIKNCSASDNSEIPRCFPLDSLDMTDVSCFYSRCSKGSLDTHKKCESFEKCLDCYCCCCCHNGCKLVLLIFIQNK